MLQMAYRPTTLLRQARSRIALAMIRPLSQIPDPPLADYHN